MRLYKPDNPAGSRGRSLSMHFQRSGEMPFQVQGATPCLCLFEGKDYFGSVVFREAFLSFDLTVISPP